MGQGVGLQCSKSPLPHRLITSALHCLINHSRQGSTGPKIGRYPRHQAQDPVHLSREGRPRLAGSANSSVPYTSRRHLHQIRRNTTPKITGKTRRARRSILSARASLFRATRAADEAVRPGASKGPRPRAPHLDVKGPFPGAMGHVNPRIHPEQAGDTISQTCALCKNCFAASKIPEIGGSPTYSGKPDNAPSAEEIPPNLHLGQNHLLSLVFHHGKIKGTFVLKQLMNIAVMRPPLLNWPPCSPPRSSHLSIAQHLPRNIPSSLLPTGKRASSLR